MMDVGILQIIQTPQVLMKQHERLLQTYGVESADI